MAPLNTIILYLIGVTGTGKYTIAQEIAKEGFKVVDNHLINNPIFSLLPLDGITPVPNAAWEAIESIRQAILSFIAQDTVSHYVFTNELLETDYDHGIYQQIVEMATIRHSLFVPVKLLISPEENKHRIINPLRKERFKVTNLAEASLPKTLIHIDHPRLITLDVTHLTASAAAMSILSKIPKRTQSASS